MLDERVPPPWANTQQGQEVAKLLRHLDGIVRNFPNVLNKRQRLWMREIQRHAQPRRAPTNKMVAVLKEKIDKFETYLASPNKQQNAKRGRVVDEAERIAHTQDFTRRRRLYLSGGKRTSLPPAQHKWWHHHRGSNSPAAST